MTTNKFTFKKIDAQGANHAVGDPKPPTRYEVYVGDVKIGEVASCSEESWATSGRIRTRMLGYNRSWRGTLTGETYISWRRADGWASTRQWAAEELLRAYRATN